MALQPEDLDLNEHEEDSDEDVLLDPDEAEEDVDVDEDLPMDSDGEEDANASIQELAFQNDSLAYFDTHKDSIFCVAQHPLNPSIIATGGGDDTGYVFDASSAQPLHVPGTEREALSPVCMLSGHTDSVNAISFTLPSGDYLFTAGLDGALRAFRSGSKDLHTWTFLASVQEVEEINFLVPCPSSSHPNTIALGASDGSIWVYSVDASDTSSPLTNVQAYYLHGGAATAGAWSPDGAFLATCADDGSFYVWDVFGEAAAAGLGDAGGNQYIVGLTTSDERFKIEAGLYSVAISPNAAFAAVGGADGQIRIVGLPRLGVQVVAPGNAGNVKTSSGTKGKVGGARQPPAKSGAATASQTGVILASLQPLGDGIETLAFAAPPLTLLAAGSVDGGIALLDCAHRFAVRRHIRSAHEDEAVIKVEFAPMAGHTAVGSTAPGMGGWLLTSCGNDGVVRRWDARGGTAAAAQGLVGEWRGHRGGGEGGGVLGFVQGGGRYIVTAGDDGVSLVFDTSSVH